ncbi:MAG: cysteine desulfurase [Magnetospirillum gryphiswaldense]|nr:cysteine desulfurase [Magnetospirillum gryphiswaldense]
MSVSVYLDYNAGAPARPEVIDAMVETLKAAGNPSSVHDFGRRARARLEAARRDIAAAVGGDAAGVVFTSGGTEANALALRGTGRRVLVSDIEHASVRQCGPAQIIPAQIIPVGADGVVDLEALDRLLAADPTPALVSVMLANNETGVIQPVAEVVRLARARGALVHCDAAQGLGRLPVFLSDLDVDFLTLSAHKMGGPSGIGCLLLSKSDISLAPILLGGGQEKSRRAGTENLAGIVGFATAARLAAEEAKGGDAPARMRTLRDTLEAQAVERVPEARIVGGSSPRLCNTSCLILPDVAAQVQVMALDLAGVMVSAGSACSSGKVASSHVLAAMGLGPGLADCALRVSLGPDSQAQDVDAFLSAWSELARRKGKTVKDAA